MYRTWQGGAEIAAIVIFVSILVMDHFEAGCIWSVSTLNGLGVDLWWRAHWPQNTEYWPMWHITVLQAHVHSNSHHLPITPLDPSLITTHCIALDSFIYLTYILLYELLSITRKGGSWCWVLKKYWPISLDSHGVQIGRGRERERSSERLWHSDSRELTVE